MHRLCHDMEGAFMAAMERRVEPVICDGLASYPRKVHCRLLRSISLRRIDRCPSPSEAGSGWEAVPCGRHDRFAVQNSAVWHRSSKSIARLLQLARPKMKHRPERFKLGATLQRLPSHFVGVVHRFLMDGSTRCSRTRPTHCTVRANGGGTRKVPVGFAYRGQASHEYRVMLCRQGGPS